MHKTHPVDAVDVVSAEWSDGSGGHQIGVELGHVVEAPDCSDLDDLLSWGAGRLQVKVDKLIGHDEEWKMRPTQKRAKQMMVDE